MKDRTIPTRDRVDVIGVPMDLGASRRGVGMGPYAVRYARLHERLAKLGIAHIEDHGNLHVPIREKAAQDEDNAKFFGTIRSVCDELAGVVERALHAGGFPVVLGGDHSIAMGTLAGLTRARGYAPGLVWIDAHSDINSPDTSPSGNVHGMPLWFALENGFADPARTVQIGLRDVDAHEKEILRKSGVRAFDMDGIDPSEAPGTGTPVKGGLSYREAHLAMEMLAESGRLGSIEMVEINPILDHRNQTAALAVGLICSGLGKSIL